MQMNCLHIFYWKTRLIKRSLCCKSLNVHTKILQLRRKATKSGHFATILSEVSMHTWTAKVLACLFCLQMNALQLKVSHFIQRSGNLQRPLVTSHTPTNKAGTQLFNLQQSWQKPEDDVTVRNTGPHLHLMLLKYYCWTDYMGMNFVFQHQDFRSKCIWMYEWCLDDI